MIEIKTINEEFESKGSVVEQAQLIVLQQFSRERASLARALRRDRLQLMGEIQQLEEAENPLLQERRDMFQSQLDGLDKRLVRALIFDF
jgi:hypothetical protein